MPTGTAMPLPPPTGQDPLATLPQYGGAGGGQQAAQYYAGQYFNQLFGRNPTQAELSQYAPYFMGADPNIANVAGGDQAISSYFTQQQNAANAPGQEASAIQQQIPIISNLVQNQTQAIGQDLTNPNSPTYQQFSGLLNNMGITPQSGAFQSGLGGTLGANAANAENAALGSVGLPIASGYAQGQMAPFTQQQQQPLDLFQNNMGLNNALQEIAAIPKQGSNMWSDIAGGALSGAAQGGAKGGPWGALAGGAAGAGGGYAQGRSTYICTELCDRGLLTREEVDRIHTHLFKAKWKRPFKFLGYFLFGKFLVILANAVNTHWGTWKPEFYDRVMEESDPVKAVDIYADSFWHLYANVKWRREFFYGL